MKTINPKRSCTYATSGPWVRASVTSILLASTAYMFGLVTSCSSEQQSQLTRDKLDTKLTPISIPVNLIYQPKSESEGLGLSDGGGLGLLSTATNIYVSVSGCASGYSANDVAIASGSVKLYKNDYTCVVKLRKFDIGSVTYSATATGATNFSAWTAGSVATFANTLSSTDVINVFVSDQVSSPVLSSGDNVDYTFTDITAGTAQSISQANVSTAVPISVTGRSPPAMSVLAKRFLETNANGSADLSFTIDCDSNITGTSSANYACNGFSLADDLHLILAPDEYSGGALTLGNAVSIFSSFTPGTISGANMIAIGGSDSASNTVPHGGFETGTLVTQDSSPPIYPDNLSQILIFRAQDSSNNVVAYLYFYVTISSITQS